MKLALWVGEQALPHYAGPGKKGLEQAVALAKRAAAGEPYTEEETRMILEAVKQVNLYAATDQQGRVIKVIWNTAQTLLRVVLDTCWCIPTGGALCGMARVAHHAGADWRQWMEEYLRIRLEA